MSDREFFMFGTHISDASIAWIFLALGVLIGLAIAEVAWWANNRQK